MYPTSTTNRIGQCLATALLTAALAVGAAATASAERVWDIGAYDECMGMFPDDETPSEHIATEKACCAASGGDWASTPEFPNIGECVAPPAELENMPGQPEPTATPPVLQNPPRNPSNPLLPTPRGPDSGTLG